MPNGGVIGADNAATFGSAPGVWTVDDLYTASRGNRWPRLPGVLGDGIIEAVMNLAVGNVSGALVTDFQPTHIVGNTEGRFTADTSTNQITVITSGEPPGHQLAVDDEVFFRGAQTDMPAGLIIDQPYYVKSVPTTTTLTLALEIGGDEIDITTAGTNATTRRLYKRPGAGDPAIELEVFHVSSAVAPSGLTIDSLYEIGEDSDKDMRITALVVDRDLVIGSGGTLRITNNRRRLGFMIASRENVTIGPGTWTIPMFQNTNPPAPAPTQLRGHPQFRRHLVDVRLPLANGYLVAGANGGDGGRGGGGITPGPNQVFRGNGGGGGGSAFGGVGGLGGPAILPGTPGTPGNGTAGGVGAPGAALGGGLPGNQNIMRNLAIVYGNDVTIPGPGPTVRINAAGGNGNPSFGIQGAGGGGAGGLVYVIHAGAYTNNGTISVAGGTGGTVTPSGPVPAPSPVPAPGTGGAPGSAGTVVAEPVPAVV